MEVIRDVEIVLEGGGPHCRGGVDKSNAFLVAEGPELRGFAVEVEIVGIEVPEGLESLPVARLNLLTTWKVYEHEHRPMLRGRLVHALQQREEIRVQRRRHLVTLLVEHAPVASEVD